MDHQAPYTLLTGATGLIGSQLLARLMRRHVPVIVLLRKHHEASSIRRIETILQRFEQRWQRRLSRPVIVEGDLTAAGVGLSTSDRKLLLDRCSSVIHLAASLSFRQADPKKGNEPYRTNYDGTKELLKIWEHTGIGAFHHVSTAYVCGKVSHAFEETDLDVGQEFANDYERSKLLTEQMLRGSKAIGKLTVYRPSIVIDTSGDSPSSQDRTIYVAFAMYRTMAKKFGFLSDGAWFDFLGCSGDDRKNIVDASWVADVIDGIVANASLHGETFNLTASQGTKIEDIERAFKMVVEASPGATTGSSSERKAKQNSTSQEGASVVSRVMAFSKNAIVGNARTIALTIAGPYLETFEPYFRNDPLFGRNNLLRALTKVCVADQQPIGSEAIMQFALNQQAELDAETNEKLKKRQASLRTDPSTSLALVGETLWSERLGQWQSEETKLGKRPIDVPSNHSKQDDWGIVLSGQGGVDLLAASQPFGLLPAGQGCARVLYMNVDDWNEWLFDRVSLEQLIERNRISIEIDEDASNEEDALASLHRLVEELRLHLLPQFYEGAK